MTFSADAADEAVGIGATRKLTGTKILYSSSYR
jgi:hypothetical protein